MKKVLKPRDRFSLLDADLFTCMSAMSINRDRTSASRPAWHSSNYMVMRSVLIDLALLRCWYLSHMHNAQVICPSWEKYRSLNDFNGIRCVPTQIMAPHYWASSRENLNFVACNNKGADQPAHPRSLFSSFLIHSLDRLIIEAALRQISIF